MGKFFLNLQIKFHFKAINPDFRLQPYQPPESSLEKRVKTIMQDAFWDLLREQLNADPPTYDHAISLLGDIKEVSQIVLNTFNVYILLIICKIFRVSIILSRRITKKL